MKCLQGYRRVHDTSRRKHIPNISGYSAQRLHSPMTSLPPVRTALTKGQPRKVPLDRLPDAQISEYLVVFPRFYDFDACLASLQKSPNLPLWLLACMNLKY